MEFLSQACVRLTMEAMTLDKENSFLHNGAKGVAQEKESQVGLLRKRLGAVFRSSIDHTSSGRHLRDPHIRSVSCQQAQQSTCLVGVVSCSQFPKSLSLGFGR